MIQELANRYPRLIAYLFFLIFTASINPALGQKSNFRIANTKTTYYPFISKTRNSHPIAETDIIEANSSTFQKRNVKVPVEPTIGGPNQPEMSSFKSVGADNMVNLFTGDFSYNIPLMDVGGYPINIFYDGGVTMEQEASWVGLGWNINPGNVSRNMRGVPDDFNGTDTLLQTQRMKPNVTIGGSLGADLELVGIKDLKIIQKFTGSVGASLGISFNNYLGPALELGLKGSTSFRVAGNAGSEKLGIGGGIGANISSRNGVTISPSLSLNARAFHANNSLGGGIGISTSYNSRSGIKQLQISEQMSFSANNVKKTLDYDKSGTRGFSSASSISFLKPSYIPALRMPMLNTAFAGRFEVGIGIFGGRGALEVEVYKQRSETEPSQVFQKKPLVGYMYYQNAIGNPNAVMDFTRLNDNEVTPNTPIISAPQYTYDVFSIQGEGTGGSIRAYRNDMGYVRDNISKSQDKSTSVGADFGPVGHFGANVNTIKTPSYISEWKNGNKIRTVSNFTNAYQLNENVYFRNPGETSVLNDSEFNRIGGVDLVRFRLGGTNSAPAIDPVMEKFSRGNVPFGTVDITQEVPSYRKKRTQVTTFLTAAEASVLGLDTAIKNYRTDSILTSSNNLAYSVIPRVGGYRKSHHISEITVLEANGKRYVYGLPVYNITQKDFSFTVGDNHPDSGLVTFSAGDATSSSLYLSQGSKKDGFMQSTVTPAFSNSFLLSGLLSSDYVDVTGDGITEDDFGDAVKFNYTKTSQDHKWRTPLTSDLKANFNPGNRTETKDDKGIISYGERESWYMHSIESKTMIALFTLESRADGKGATDSVQGINSSDASSRRLKKIDLYNKADLKKNGIQNATPVKTVWFEYNYSLCPGTPDNTTSGGGKLTLETIYFTFNGKKRTNKNKYVFSYTDSTSVNPNYAAGASDRWGNYKASYQNPAGLKNSIYPYSVQSKAVADSNAKAWALKKILLPSGGQLEVEYESDDYAFVQNKRASNMMQIYGLGYDSLSSNNRLYVFNDFDQKENVYVFVQLAEACSTKTIAFKKYLEGQNQLSFRLAVNMPKGIEYITCYATYSDYGLKDNTHLWIKLNTVDGKSPLSLAALDYLRERLPAQAFEGYDVTEGTDLEKVGHMLAGMLDGLKKTFSNPVNALREDGKAKTIDLSKSFVRLNDNDGYKYGGGQRVKKIILKDNWQKMTGQFTSQYGQEYTYTTTENFNGGERIISSGVASYEPSIGGEENPFQTIVQIANRQPMGPASFDAIEMPILDAFFPAPLVGYSKVTVKALKKINPDTTKKSRSGIGKQVTEFYTAKDFPVYYNHTSFDPSSSKESHYSSLFNFFYKYAFDSRALSQGFLVETNDMHGKMKSQSAFAENDSNSRISYTENFYRNTGAKGLNEKFPFIYSSQSGIIADGNMGIDVELMTDTREFSVKGSSLEIQGQVDLFPIILPFWIPFIWPVTGDNENTYRAVTTTKVVTYHSVVDSVVVIDKGSTVSTKNLVFDSETGSVVLNRTNNEFDNSLYTTSYPAWWAYHSMGLAYKTVGAIFTGVNFYDGKVMGNSYLDSIINSGDEIYILNTGSIGSDTCRQRIASGSNIKRLWVFDRNKDITSLAYTKDKIFIDDRGMPYTRDNVQIKIIRSGNRNLLDAQLGTITTMNNPIDTISSVPRLVIDSTKKVLAASAIEFREKWQVDNDVIGKFKLVWDSATCSTKEVTDCSGYLDKKINPYLKGLIGNSRPFRSMIYYGNRNSSNPADSTNIKTDGTITGFTNYWNFNTSGQLVPDSANTKWVWNSKLLKVNAKGQEVETVDALGIYTSAQYGYNKSLPVAIMNNARSSEGGFASFEDKNYTSSINYNDASSCLIPHFDLSSMSNSKLVCTDTVSGLSAHSGRYVLGINANSTASKGFYVRDFRDSISLQMLKDTTKRFINSGSVHDSLFKTPLTVDLLGNPGGLSSYNVNAALGTDSVVLISGGYNRYFTYSAFESGYVDVTSDGVYAITTEYTPNSIPHQKTTVTADITFQMFDKDQVEVPVNYVSTLGNLKTYSVCLKKGYYKISANFAGEGNYTCPNSEISVCDTSDAYAYPTVNFEVKFGSTYPFYKNPSTVYGCEFSKALAGADSLMNPVFSIPTSKKMLVSAWVRESCGTPCIKYDYNNNKIQLAFNGTGNTPVDIFPSGPIIEGWQRYEGYFTAPNNADSITVNFVNTTSQILYIDDVRIHPFNANMKSYVYDPVNLRLVAELDANNYTTFYEFDEEGILVRTKVETKEGVKTINETRSYKQQAIQQLQ